MYAKKKKKRLFVFIEADYELIVENVQFPRIADIKKGNNMQARSNMNTGRKAAK